MSVELFFSVFAVMFLAELPDKSAFTALLLSGRLHAGGVFAGAAAALVTQALIAVTLGSLVLRFLPPRPVHIVAGAAFLIFAVITWRKSPEEAALPGETKGGKDQFGASAMTAFGMTFLAEWGDMTQFAAAAMAARYQAPVAVFLAAAAAECTVAGLASFIGSQVGRHLPRRLFQRLAALAFFIVGLYLIVVD